MTWTVEFYVDADGKQPARDFLAALSFPKRAAAIAAIEAYLVRMGPEVCRSEMGKALGNGLYELRVRHDEKTIRRKAFGTAPDEASTGHVLLRIFFAVYGERIVLLLGGYDKGENPAARRQAREIEQARKRLRSFRLRQQRQKAAGRRRS